MSLRNLTFVTLAFLFFVHSHAQRNYDSYNRLGLQGGYTLFDITTSDFMTKSGSGLMAGFTTRGSFRNQFDLVYGISFYNSNIQIQGTNLGSTPGNYRREWMNYTIQAAQINFLGSFNIIRHHFSLEFGPVLNVNGKMKLESDQYQGFKVEGSPTFLAEDLENISKVNFRVMGGLTAGLENFRLSAQYQYGVTNMLQNLNDLGKGKDDFEGRSSTIVIAAVLYF